MAPIVPDPDVPVSLPTRRWVPINHAALSRWLLDPRARRPRVAVFDWDNTCIFNDIGDASFCYQLENLAFRLPPESLGTLLPTAISGITHLDGGVSLADWGQDIRAAYTALWPHMGHAPGNAIPSPHHRDLCAKLSALYRALERTNGIGTGFAYGWLAGWMGGFRPDEARALAAVAAAKVAHPPRAEVWESVTPGRSGHQSVTWRRGVRAIPEMQDLMIALRRCNITTYVVSASHQALVQGAAAHFGYAVPQDNVIGMRLHMDGDVYGCTLDPAYPMTNRHGKVVACQRFMAEPPVLVAGDYSTDYEMLTHFAGTEIRLVINRDCADEMRTLYLEAQRPPHSGPLTLLQGRNENTGEFRPTQESILWGETNPRQLPRH